MRERDWTLGGQEPETHGAQSRAPGKTPSNTRGEKLERNMVRRLSWRHAEMVVSLSGLCWDGRTECPRGEEQVIIRGPKPGPVSIIRCEAGWGRHQRHAMRREAAELSGHSPTLRIVMNHLGRSQSASPGGAEAGHWRDSGGCQGVLNCPAYTSHLPANFR